LVGSADDCGLRDALARHIALATQFAKGVEPTGSGALWDKAAGREAQRLVSQLQAAATPDHVMTLADYRALFGSVIADGVVRDRDAGHPQILIWGTLEARVQGADLVILGGMNEGSWPEAPPPDPWLNRAMRLQAGLLLPERRIGLSAHDYQQAIAAKDVWITRAKRSADAETVPSRWINRLTNLLDGLPAQNGPDALSQMRKRGDIWLSQAKQISTPQQAQPRATRPSPCPPIAARPCKISVTQVKTLIRDPFAIYAEKVLRLRALDPLAPSADAALRGTIYHQILEDFSRSGTDPTSPDAVAALLQIAQDQLDQDCPWPGIRAQWMARLRRIAPRFIADEAQRRRDGEIALLEGRGEILTPQAQVTLVCKADRIDLSMSGQALIYDYKTGAIPSEKQQLHFDKQLLLEAAMVERGAFTAMGEVPVQRATFVDVGAKMANVDAPLHKAAPDEVWSQFQTLMLAWQQPDRGYTARLALFSKDQAGYFDHLARYGEWTMSDPCVPQVLR
jgi:double-strand break repair protein AddB